MRLRSRGDFVVSGDDGVLVINKLSTFGNKGALLLAPQIACNYGIVTLPFSSAFAFLIFTVMLL